jgi:hypothetical protein
MFVCKLSAAAFSAPSLFANKLLFVLAADEAIDGVCDASLRCALLRSWGLG